MAEHFFFDEPEQRAVADALALLSDAKSAEQASVVRAHLDRLERVATVLRDSPAIASLASSVRRTRDGGAALLDLLCDVPAHDFDMHIPSEAVLGQAYLVSKINFFKAVDYALQTTDTPAELRERVRTEIAQSIYSKMAEEIFTSLLTDPSSPREAKLRVGGWLFRIWEDRLLAEVDDFAPVLEAAWLARDRVQPVLGTMLGTSELMRLIQEARDPQFIDHFTTSEIDTEQMQAFEEFLFGLAHEQIVELRAHLVAAGKAAVSCEQARELLGVERARWSVERHGPQALFASYRQRKVQANYRALTNTPGPKRTAEEYVMMAFLERR